ncbi:LacI family DNA-binding transcriptional regulator [soil metagenome]
MKRVTLDHLSAHLGLSKFSVSRALSGKAGVSERTRRQVFEAARQLGYDHPAMERGGAPGRKLKLLIPRADSVSSQFWGEVIAGAEAEAVRVGFDFSVDLVTEDSNSGSLVRGVSGLIVAGRRSRGLTEQYIHGDLPVVLIGHQTPFEKVDCVRSSSWASGYMMGKHFADLGHRHLAYFTDAPEDKARQERFRGLRGAMAAVDGATAVSYPYVPGSDAVAALRKSFAAREVPTALFGATDLVAMTIAWAALEMGLKIPQHISVGGCNDLPVAMHIGLKLSTIRQPTRDLGAAAIQVMDWRLERARPGEAPRQLLLQPQFIPRESTGLPNAVALGRALRSSRVMAVAG